ncbi:cytochrome P450 [Limimaricola litoreus]|uniref:Cytochrome P450 n=1 Tax=Limimaricola litoreus TaxID=2955316 RepID=A0A9X2JQI7_9RHOB|nr:cytochrome P450 [Limimaricola litoreus]MCP1169994.1 cytochrome P450 [Limimaricola litoreus]
MTGTPLPHLKAPDSTLSLLREGYDFISRRCDRLGTDGFRTRLMLRPVTCLRGPRAARAFYAPGRMTRRGAMPGGVLALLQDKGSVQGLDDAAHRHRRGLFLGLMTPEGLDRARDLLREEWQAAGMGGREIVLAEEIGPILTRTALRWCGIELEDAAPRLRHEEFEAMIGGAALIGPGHWRARLLRRRSEAWAREVIRIARAGTAPPHSPLARLARHRDPSGLALPRDVAAVELLNLLRPIVAVGRFIVFSAHAMVTQPEVFAALPDTPRALEWWGDEVRRLYPFFPAIGGRVRERFDFEGQGFAPGDWVLLDLHGTDTDPGAWPDPLRFDPMRHAQARNAFAFVPQGAGPMESGHRCPGEALTAALLAEATALLHASRPEAPPQDLRIARNRVPAAPVSGMRLRLQEPPPRAPG